MAGGVARTSHAPPWWRLALFLIGIVALAAGVVVLDSRPVGVAYDDARYVILARSLVTGQGYRNLNLPGAPVETHFPPGYPAFLALISWAGPAFPESVAFFKAVNGILLAVAAVLVTRFARLRVMSEEWAVALGLVSAVSIPTLIFGCMVLSEPLFLALAIALLPALETLVDQPSTARRALLLGVGIAACTLVRSHGIVLLMAVLLLLGFRRRWRDAALVFGGVVVCLLPWQLWAAKHSGVVPVPLRGSYESYAGWVMGGVKTVGPGIVPAILAKTVAETIEMFANLFSPIDGAVAHIVTLVALAALAATGVHATRRRIPVTLLFIAGYLAIVLVWPFSPTRFVWAIWPLLLLLIVAGASEAVNVVRKGVASGGGRIAYSGWVAIAAAFAWVTIGYGVLEVRGVRGTLWWSISRGTAPRIVAVSDWVAAHTAPDDLIATEDEGAVYLYTGRRGVPMLSFTAAQYVHDVSAEENAAQGLRPILAAYPVRTVVAVNKKAIEAADVLVKERPPRLLVRAVFPTGVAYTVPERE